MAPRPAESAAGATPPPYRRALSWSVAMVGGQQVLTALVSFVLAALLGPDSFGLVAMASIYILFMQMLLDQGIPALVQIDHLEDEHLDSAFWLVMGVTGIITVASIALAGPWAALNREPELQRVLVLLSLQVPLYGLIVVQEALLRRRMDFRALATRSLVAAAAGGVVGIALALDGAGSGALVAQQLATGVVGAAVLWKVSDWRPRLRFSRRHLRDLAGFSAGSFLASLGVFINVRSDVLLIGAFFGGAAVGLYRLASRFTEVLVDFLSRSIYQVAFPELSRLQNDRQAFARRKRDVMAQSGLLTLPALGVLAGCADQVMRVFGPEWSGAAPALQVLCVVASVRALTLISSAGLQAIGRPHVLAALSWVAAVLGAASLALVGLALRDATVSEQIQGMATSRAALFLFVIGPMYVVTIDRVCGMTPSQLLGAIGRPAVVGVVAGAAGIVWTGTGIDRGWSPALAVAAAGVVTVVAALSLMAVLDRAALRRGLAMPLAVIRPSRQPAGYRPRHLQEALVDHVLSGSASELADYRPRHLAKRGPRHLASNGHGHLDAPRPAAAGVVPT